MAGKRFKYKPSAADQIIIFIFLLAAIAFAGLLYLDQQDKFPTTGGNSAGGDIQELEELKQQLEDRLEELENDNN